MSNADTPCFRVVVLNEHSSTAKEGIKHSQMQVILRFCFGVENYLPCRVGVVAEEGLRRGGVEVAEALLL